MDIGGDDTVFKTSLSRTERLEAVRDYVRWTWPAAVEEEEPRDESWFFYINAESKAAWAEDVPFGCSLGLLHYIPNADGFTLVHDMPLQRDVLVLMLFRRFNAMIANGHGSIPEGLPPIRTDQ